MTNMFKYSFVIVAVFCLPQVFCDVANLDEGKQLGTAIAPGLGGLLGSLTGGLVGSLFQGGIRNVTSSITTAAGPVLGPVLGSVIGGLLGNLLGVSQRLGPIDDDITVWGGVLPGGGTGFGGVVARNDSDDHHDLPIKHPIYLPPAYLLNLITHPKFYNSGYRTANQQDLHENVTPKQNTSEATSTEKATTAAEQNSTSTTTITTAATTESDEHSTTHSFEPTIPTHNNEIYREPPVKKGSVNWSPYPSHDSGHHPASSGGENYLTREPQRRATTKDYRRPVTTTAIPPTRDTGKYPESGESEYYLITPKPLRRPVTKHHRRPVTTIANLPTRVYHYHQDEDFYDDCDDW